MSLIWILAPLFIVIGLVVAVIGAARAQNKRDR